MSTLLESKRRVVFYSKQDMLISNNLINAEKLLHNYTSNEKFSINDLLEIYNIKLYLENDLFLLSWTEEIKSKYKEIIEINWKLLKKKLINIDVNTIENNLNDLEFNYRENYWCLLNQLNSFQKISNSKFEEILKNYKHDLNYILQQKRLVEKFDKQVRNFLTFYRKTAEILLSLLFAYPVSFCKRKR